MIIEIPSLKGLRLKDPYVIKWLLTLLILDESLIVTIELIFLV